MAGYGADRARRASRREMRTCAAGATEARASADLPHGGGQPDQDRPDDQQFRGIGHRQRPQGRGARAGRSRDDDGRCNRGRGRCGGWSRTCGPPPGRGLERERKADRYDKRGDEPREQHHTKSFSPHHPHVRVTPTWNRPPVRRARQVVRSLAPDETSSDVPRACRDAR